MIQGLSDPVVLHPGTNSTPAVHSTHDNPAHGVQLDAAFQLPPRRFFDTHCTMLLPY
jgi:hypothetical protein